MKKTIFWFFTLVLVFTFSQAALAADAKDKGKDGGKPAWVIISETIQAKATVTAVDQGKRTMTIKGPEGNELNLSVDESIKNFDQIKQGDNVVATYYESIILSIQKPAEAPAVTDTEVVKIAPKGKKPGALVLDTVKMEAVVDAVNAKNRKVSLKMPDGKIKKIKVSEKVKNLDKLQKGDRIVVRLTEAVAIAVTKP